MKKIISVLWVMFKLLCVFCFAICTWTFVRGTIDESLMLMRTGYSSMLGWSALLQATGLIDLGLN